MTSKFLVWLSVMVAILASLNVGTAGVYQYECEVHEEQEISGAGKLGEPEVSLYADKTFHVDSKSGTVLGGGLGNATYPDKIILDPGNKHMSYKLLWVSKEISRLEGSHNAVYLEIQEWSENYSKPFILVTSGKVLTGTCD